MHKLQKQVMLVNYYDEAGVDQFYSKALHILNKDLSQEMELIMDKHCSSGQLIRINNLTIDLGIAYESELHYQWITRFREEFEKQLLHKIQQIRQGLGSVGESILLDHEKDLELLIFYLKNGALPWNAGNSKLNIDFIFNAVLSEFPSELVRSLREETNKERTIQRLAIQFSDQQIEKLIMVIQPSESNFIIQSAGEIRKSQQRDHIVRSGDKEFRDAIWKFILTYLLHDSGSYFNRRMFISALLHRMANHFNVEFSVLISGIFKSIQQIKVVSVHFKLGILLQEIYEADQRENEQVLAVKELSGQDFTFLLEGENMQNETRKSPHLQRQKLTKWMASSPLGFIRFLKHQDPSTFLRIVGLLSDEDLEQLFRWMNPSVANFTFDFYSEINKLQREYHWFGKGIKEFKEEFRVVLLSILLNDKGALINTKVFVLTALEQMSERIGKKPWYLIEEIIRLTGDEQAMFTNRNISGIFKEIRKDFLSAGSHLFSSADSRIKASYNCLDLFISGKETSRTKGYTASAVSGFDSLNETIRYLASKDPSAFDNWLKKNITSETLIQRLFGESQIAELKQVLKILKLRLDIQVEDYMDLFLDLNSRFSRKRRSIDELELYRLTLVFLFTSQRKKDMKKRYLEFMIRRLAGIMMLHEEQIVKAVFESAYKTKGLLDTGMIAHLENSFTSDISPGNKAPIQSAIDKRPRKSMNLPQDKESCFMPVIKFYNEISWIESSQGLSHWMGERLSAISYNDLPELRNLLTAYFRKKIENKWTGHLIPALHSRKILSGISNIESPFLERYLHDLEFLRNQEVSDLTGINFDQLLEKVLYYWVSSPGLTRKDFTRFIVIDISQKKRKPKDETRSRLFELAKRHHKQLISTLVIDLAETDVPHAEIVTKDRVLDLKPAKKTMPQDKTTADAQPDETDTLYIENAGLVLLNPFIPVFFERAGLLLNRSFISKEKQTQAVHLLQYCVSYQEHNAEFLMTLPKILCGMEYNEPIDIDVIITKAGKELADSLLKNVISQWNILRETKVDGLQQTFIARSGVLRLRSESWELEVEKRPFDMLLDKIPWTYSLIKYPWMPKPLSTIWR